MVIPDFTADGLLPAGAFECNLSDAYDRFACNPTRNALWANLMIVLDEMRAANLSGDLYIDGSFVTDKEVPGDIEVTLDVRSETMEKQGLAVLFFYSNHGRLKDQNSVDWYPTLPSQNDFISFFQYLGYKTAAIKKLNPKDPKGILKIPSW